MTATLKMRSGTAFVSLTAIALACTPFAIASPTPFGNSATTVSAQAEGSEIDLETREKADPFITVKGDQFIIDSAAKSALTPSEMRKVEASVEAANAAIDSASATENPSVRKTTSDKTVTFTQEIGPRIENTDSDTITPYFQPGRNGIEYHWWGVKVLLSQGTLKAIGLGVSIAGLWIPEPVVSKIAGSLGIVAAAAPGGIWADYSYAQFALITVTPQAASPMRVGFQ